MGLAVPAGGTVAGEASSLCDARNGRLGPVAMRPMLERTVKGALLTNLLFVLGIFLSQWAA
ncbi:hypothetical protein EIMP300_05090 [Escherichia coli]|uniref:1,4-dihydroxy-2-naphthoate octaprenyltransferase n=1 Tax=Escherichia coli TaxID=562 RepID=A0A8S0FI46_ECOLX|nr:hypothetical protein EIMP300_05090 [Escherichia coli]